VLNRLFFGPFYGQYKVENHENLTSLINDKLKTTEDYHGWNNNCNVQVKMLDNIEFAIPYFKPCLKQFCDELNAKINVDIVESGWVSCYNVGSYQEVHQHCNCDISMVYFLNSGEGFSNFYFLDRHSNDYSDAWIRKVFPKEMSDTFTPSISAGDLIIFPSHLYHGVTIHKSDVTRKTLALNMNIHSIG
jgi:hypothetical protein